MILNVLKKPSPARDAGLTVFSAVLLILSHPPYNFGFLAWLALIPFFVALDGKTVRQGFRLGYFFGAVYSFGMFGWLIHATLPGMVLFNLYMALYPAFFGVLYVFWRSRLLPGSIQAVMVASSWVVAEFLRATLFSGFGWACLGHSQYQTLPVIQIADIVGVFGISFVLVVINMTLRYILGQERAERPLAVWRLAGFSIFILAGVLTYGFYSLSQNAFLPKEARSLKVTIIQPNVIQAEKWVPANWERIMDKLERMSRQAVGRSGDVDVIIWPETALPGYRWESPQYFERARQLAKELKTPLLLGTESQDGNQFFNSAVLISSQGKEIGRYDKIHLVPFGEFIPLRPVLSFIEYFVPMEDLSPGWEKTVFVLGNPKVGVSVLICFEDTVGHVSRAMVRAGAQVLVNITNDAWFLRTKAPFLHLQMSVFEAVENRRPMIRAANTGVSGIIHPSGRMAGVIQNASGDETFITGQLNARIPVAGNQQTLITRYGNFFVYFCFVCLMFGVIIDINIRRNAKKENS